MTAMLALTSAVACSGDALTAPRVAPAPALVTHICIDNCGGQATHEPYTVMAIDGAVYRLPEDSLRLRLSLEQLRPEEIDTIEIVKAASAAQLYGARPAIVITTKRARNH